MTNVKRIAYSGQINCTVPLADQECERGLQPRQMEVLLLWLCFQGEKVSEIRQVDRYLQLIYKTSCKLLVR